MLARLQQAITLGLLAFAAAWGVLWWRAGHEAWAVAGVLLTLGGHAVVLALEFAMLALARGDDPAPRASAAQLLRAWWGETQAAPRVFSWRQPFRSRRFPDHVPPGARGRRGVLLVHGFVCNRGLWNPWLGRLLAADVPFVAVNLEPVFGSIDQYAELVEQAVQRLERATGLAPVLVAHSMGGLAVRRWYAEQADAARVHHVVTIASPHHGTWLARFALTRNSRQMRLQSRWLATLAAREHVARHGRFTCFYGHCDNIVFPPSTAVLEGARNVHIAGTAHVEMADRPEPWDELQRLLAAAPAPLPPSAPAAQTAPTAMPPVAPAPD
ncbi:MAG: esterase/lipase family protein [Pseudomonadota bacterium]|jgi:triacylglycerol lipase|nr:alpha/beta hydrolase [Rubrivivax sp.]